VSRVSSASLGSGNAGHVTLDAPRIVLDDRGAILTTAVPYYGVKGLGGGAISITADELVASDEARIHASTFISGPGGDSDVTARDSITISGADIASRTGGEGAGGHIVLRAPRIEIANGGSIATESGPDSYDEVARTVVGGLPPLDPVANPGDAGSITL